MISSSRARIAAALAALLALGLATGLALRPRRGPVENPPIIANIPSDRVDRLEISRASGGARTRAVLVRSGGAWRLEAPVRYAADQRAVRNMLVALAGLRATEVVTALRSRHRELEVDEALGIEVAAFSGRQALARMVIGLSSGGFTYVRRAGEDAVLRAPGVFRTVFDLTPTELRDRTITGLDPASVTRIRYESERGALSLSRRPEDGRLEPVGQAIPNFDEELAERYLRILADLKARDFADGPKDDAVTGLGPGAARIEVDGAAGGKRVAFSVLAGREIAARRLTHVKTSLSDQVFLVSSHMISSLKADASDFARTDEQVKAEAEARKRLAEHARMHGGPGNE